ncbi:DUF2867 domain-containing protein [Desulfospira joergensenii]|uniref:DUF2867 domain-containing protein n=1 Tax=Desulfospira joergensenii TaxID=53329 RepID=UPI0003B39BD4|nr:DUF2867 domain-containing protein [Desulfospira joergensenii]
MKDQVKIFKLKKLPVGTLITKNLSNVDYHDSYMIMVEKDESIERISEKILSLPRWVIVALRIRYYLLVKPFGLNTGKFTDIEKESESNFVPVPIIDKNENEIVMGADDKHLYYRISAMKKKGEEITEIYLNTIVKFHNIFGKIYFVPVRIGHKLVVRSILKKMSYNYNS